MGLLVAAVAAGRLRWRRATRHRVSPPLAALGSTFIETAARPVTHTPGQSVGAYPAWHGAHVGLAWSDNSVGEYEIYFEEFNAGAVPLGPPRRLTTNRTASLIPAIVSWRAGFALAWNEYVSGAAAAHASGGQHSYAVLQRVPE